MSLIVRVILAVLIACIVTGVLDYVGALNHGLNLLIGVALALAFYFGYHDRRVL